MHRSLTRNGYILDKKKLSEAQIKLIKKELNVKPKIHPDYDKDVKPFKVYQYKDGKYFVPRYWAEKYFGPPLKKINMEGAPVDINFNGALRSYQEPIFNSCIKDIRESGGGIISLYCGAGKTALAIYIATVLKLKTLVVVHKTFLQNQWYDRISQFTDARIGTIRQKKVDVENRDIVIGMLQSIAMKDYPEGVFDDFGLVIFDETHHVASRVFSQVFKKVCCKYTIGLSATPQRADGLTKIIKWHIGDIIYKLERKGDNSVLVKTFNYVSNNRLFKERKQWFNGKMRPAIQKMITSMYKIDERNTFIVNLIDSLKNQDERKILVLSGRLEHLNLLKKGIDQRIQEQTESGSIIEGEFSTSFYIGKMKEYQLEEAASADIIFATYEMAAEGLDIDRLNTLIFATPKKNVIQSVGRILRKQFKLGDTQPMVVDIIDNFSTFNAWGNHREKYYRSKKYTIDVYEAFNERCVSPREYLILNGVIKEDDQDVDIRKELITHKYCAYEYEMMQADDFEDDTYDYNYDPSFDTIFKIDYGDDHGEDDDDDDIFANAKKKIDKK